MHPKKSLGQNFLIDPNYKRKIADAVVKINPQALLEIGPGRGALTEELVQIGCPLVLVEKDKDLGGALQERFAAHKHVTVWIGDFLEFPFPNVGAQHAAPLPGNKFTVVGNLPYNMASQIFIRLLENHENFSDLLLMFQKEMALRFVAMPGTKDYGLLTLWARAYSEAKILFHLPPTVFKPQPKVDSSFVHFRILEKSMLAPEETSFFWEVMHKLFQQRRKTLRSVLRRINPAMGELPLLHASPNARAETLSLEQLIALARFLQ